MKKKIRMQPLQLSRETIRQLDHDKLVGIAGGAKDTVTQLTTGCPAVS
jgi:hypothetical protein